MMPPHIMAILGASRADVATPILTALTDPLVATVLGAGGVRPRLGIRFSSGGVILEAVGDTGVSLSYNSVGNWLDDITGLDNTDWEVRIVIDSETNDPGTWAGPSIGSFNVLSTTRTYEWTKDANDLGSADTILTVTLRQVSNTGNSATRSALDYSAQITL